MNVYKKLMQARIDLQNTTLTKSGHNKFAGYKYFELGDFIPAIQNIFNGLGLCGTISYTNDLATLTIVDMSDLSKIEITSPMSEAALKGCHAVQNLGAVQTYIRRYLWVAALEIVEHDALDSSEGAAVTIDVNMMADHITAINDATDEPSLIKAYQAAYKACGTDKAWQKKIIGVKDVKKAALK